MPKRKQAIFSVEVILDDNERHLIPLLKPQRSPLFRRPGYGGRPLKYGKALGRTKQFSCWLPTKLIEQVDAYRSGQGLNRSEWLTKLLIEHMKASESSSEPSAVS